MERRDPHPRIVGRHFRAEEVRDGDRAMIKMIATTIKKFDKRETLLFLHDTSISPRAKIAPTSNTIDLKFS